MTQYFTIAVTGQSLIKHDIRTVETKGFLGVQDIIGQSDFAFTNFETTILGRHGGWPLKGSFFGASRPVVLDTLRSIGFEGLTLSNNHAFDLGPSGVLSTMEEVEARGFVYAGAGRNRKEASLPGYGSFAGRDIALVAMDGGPGPDFMYAADAEVDRPERPGINRLKLSKVLDVDATAFKQLKSIRDRLGYTDMDLGNDAQPDDTPTIDPETEIAMARALFRRSDRFGRNVKIDASDLKRNLSAITVAAENGDMVIAYLHHHHWASDWYQVSDWVGSVAKQCIDAGAAMFVSHGAPVLQPVEIYRGRPIFYSLGNFIFHIRSEGSKWTAREIWESVVGLCSFTPDGRLARMAFYPVVIGGHDALQTDALDKRLAPELAHGEDADRILSRFQKQSASFGTQIRISGGVGIYETEAILLEGMQGEDAS
ncbi:CapA family protein [Neorhizobium sp. NCHU2750]|uniref:CapA family protein n=1 Tax=Neorhizobium sp. NCHU2750 TaxID=1825976 RepID=UPI000E724657|nr:poly-gamma-glutamate synthesis protein [Neorhizobium sp. NCHU2750]